MLKLFSILLYFILSISITMGCTIDEVRNQGKIKVIGHRGAGGLAPENTMQAVQIALQLRVDIIEIDVHCTKDGQIVVIHDSKVNRTTNGKGRIASLTYDYIKTLNIVDAKSNLTDYKVPLLEDVIKSLKNDAILLIEIKYGSKKYPGIEKKVIEIVNKCKALDYCIIQSFNDEVLEKIHQIEPKIEIHKLFYGNFLGFGIKRRRLDTYNYVTAFNINYNGVGKRFIQKAKKMGKEVNFWTVNNEKEMKKCINMGGDGIITDNPDVLLEILKSKE